MKRYNPQPVLKRFQPPGIMKEYEDGEWVRFSSVVQTAINMARTFGNDWSHITEGDIIHFLEHN